jgi:hypothetical protein
MTVTAMRYSSFAVAAVLFVVMGCIRRDPNASVLSPLGESIGEGFLGDSTPPQFIGFIDDLAESVFKNLARSGRYQIAPRGTHLLCPSNQALGQHGYVLGAHVDTLMGDSALVTMSWSCNRANQSMQQTGDYLLRRRHGKWQIERALGGGIGVLGYRTATPPNEYWS